MNKTRFFDRIDKIDDIKAFSELVCREYKLGYYENTSIIEIGYEDFNAVISTSTGKYFMKIFNNSRNDEEVKNIIERAYVAEQNNVKAPKVYKNSKDSIVTNLNYNCSKYRLSIMQYIDGKNFLELKRPATINELKQIANLCSSINKISYKPNFIYDSWAITSFITEYEKKKHYISKEHLKLVQPIYEHFKSFNYDSLPKSFVHGDITQINLMKDKDGGFWIVDFSVSNYTARINEIIIICNNFAVIPDNPLESQKRIKIAFKEWARNVNATDLERNSFRILFNVANAIYIVNSSYELAKGNTSEENKMFLNLGTNGLSLNIDLENETIS